MIGVILAAGKGSRLGSLTEDTPKSLLPLNDETTLLDYNLNVLEALQVDRIVIVTGFSSKRIEAHVTNRANVECVFNPFWNVCNVLGSLFMSLPYLNDDFLFLHADTLVGLDVWKKLAQSDGDVVLPYQIKVCGAEEMKVQHSQDGKLLNINKEMDPADAEGEFLGIAKFSGALLPYLKETSTQVFREKGLHQYMESIVQEAIEGKREITTFDIGQSPFVEVDFEEDYEQARKIFG
jgi:choline kinase